MDIKKVIASIEVYLEICPPQKKHINSHVAGFMASQQKISSPMLPLYSLGAGDKKADDFNLQLLQSVLSRCDDDALDELLEEYGDDSVIGQAVRKKRAEDYAKVICDPAAVAKNIEENLASSKRVNPFYDSVIAHMERQGFSTDADFYNSIGMPRQLFAKIRDASNNLSKKTVLWIVVGLKLDYSQASDLVRKAGYTFRKGDMRDVVLSYILRNTKYDLFSVNEILEHFGLEILG